MEPSSFRKYPSTPILTGKDLHRSDHPEESPLPSPVPCTSEGTERAIQITLHTRLFITALDGVGPQAAIDADGIHGFLVRDKGFNGMITHDKCCCTRGASSEVIVGAPPPATSAMPPSSADTPGFV